MTVTHRTLDGGWALCIEPDVCELLFHFPGTTPAAMAMVPFSLLLELAGIVDPGEPGDPKTLELRVWRNAAGQPHRAYDLPAIIYTDGTMDWWYDGQLHRGHDRPAVIDADGSHFWYWHSREHRGGGKPARIIPHMDTYEWCSDDTIYHEDTRPAIIGPGGRLNYAVTLADLL